MDGSRVEGLRLIIEMTATMAFALSGLVEAARRKLDLVGACVAAFLTAFGGGTLRDLLLDQRPFFWVRHTEYVWALLVLSAVALVVMNARHMALTERAILLPDALGLGLFAASAVDLALSLGYPALIAVLMGVVTGTAGGALRDVICNEIPRVLRDHRPYALLAFVGGWLYVGLEKASIHPDVALLLTVAVVAGLRGVSLFRRWRIPRWRM